MKYFVGAQEREQCWRWIGFGLFYRQCDNGVNALRNVNLSMNSFTVADIDAFTQTLENPAELLKYRWLGELVPRESGSVNLPSDFKLAVKKGAVIRPDPDSASFRAALHFQRS